MSTKFSVTLVNEAKGLNQTIMVGEDEIILDIAEEAGIELPYSCCAGACFDCLGVLLEGTVEQTEKALSFLKPDELKSGYVLLCSATPTSNCKVLTHQSEEIFG
ncbi:2Fe-2S iron-sulfur cluster-binding protein [Synechocystis sp. LKSZ1]|uniref:2Fe-2S iron-sulfur cluster-binding protein n=1 Tax=Synechocystis sp. LKSZ1 TaxID=3144951 RepID=UPI00336C1991